MCKFSKSHHSQWTSLRVKKLKVYFKLIKVDFKFSLQTSFSFEKIPNAHNIETLRVLQPTMGISDGESDRKENDESR